MIGRYPTQNPKGGRPRKAPLGMTAPPITILTDRDTRRDLEELLHAFRVADITHNVSRADVVRALINWAAEQLRNGNSHAFLPRKRGSAC